MSIIAKTRPVTTGLRLVQHPVPAAALGLAISHLMTKPAFARLPFGSWARVLVGQINRRHYALALDPAGRTRGFLGWAIADETAATAWLSGTTGLETSGDAGDCIILNAWSADTAAVNRLLLQAAREAAAPHRLIFFKRHYPGGRARSGKLTVPDFIGNSIPARKGAIIRT